MQIQIQIRPIELDDIDAVVALAIRAWAPVHDSMADVLGERLNALVYPDWAASQAEDVRAACRNPDVLVSVALDGGELLGFVTVVIGADATGEVDMIAVDPQAQRRGVGRALTDHALGQMRAAGCTLAVIATGGDVGHAPARELYRSAGFTPLPLVRYYRRI